VNLHNHIDFYCLIDMNKDKFIGFVFSPSNISAMAFKYMHYSFNYSVYLSITFTNEKITNQKPGTDPSLDTCVLQFTANWLMLIRVMHQFPLARLFL
jgi:hypothetical protein